MGVVALFTNDGDNCRMVVRLGLNCIVVIDHPHGDGGRASNNFWCPRSEHSFQQTMGPCTRT
jgi:hypothetical protein